MSDTEYPSADEILGIHADIVADGPQTEAGVRSPAAVESALTYISEGYFGEKPETLHEKAAQLMRLLVADHPFVDGNKRTALAAVGLLYVHNGREFDHDDEVRQILHKFATDADAVEMDHVVEYCREHTRPIA